MNRFVSILYESRYVLFLLVAIKLVLFAISPIMYAFWNEKIPTLMQLFYHWDVRHYLDIAEHGYTLIERGNFFHVVFMPLWPGLIYGLKLIVGDGLISGLIWAQVFSLLGAAFLFATLKKDYGEKVAFMTIFLLFIFPTSYFFHLPYTESLFLFFLGGFFYALRSHSFFVAALWGFFAASTRVMGFLLIVPYVVEWFLKYRTKINLKFFYPIIIACGFGVYLLFNYYVGGDYFYFLEIQKHHWTHKTMSLIEIPQHIYYAFTGLFNWTSATANDIIVSKIEPFFSLLGGALLIAGWKKLKPTYFFYALVNFILIFAQSFWMSNTRYMLIIFPVFIVLAAYFTDSTQKRGALFSPRFILFAAWSFFSISLLTLFYLRFILGQLTVI